MGSRWSSWACCAGGSGRLWSQDARCFGLSTELGRKPAKWVEVNLVPAVDALEAEEKLPYDLMRGFITTFGVDEMARSAMKKLEQRASTGADVEVEVDGDAGGAMMRDAAMSALVGIELSRVSPGFTMAFGASLGLCGGAIMRRGTMEQRRRFGLPVVTGELARPTQARPRSGSEMPASCSARPSRSPCTR